MEQHTRRGEIVLEPFSGSGSQLIAAEHLRRAGRTRCHLLLRDELKAAYGDAGHGLAKQRIIQKVMERIVDQTIPWVVIDSPHVDWNPFTNAVAPAADGPSIVTALPWHSTSS